MTANVLLFLLQALNKSKANGIILGYRIRSEKQTDHTVIQEDNTTSLNYSLLLTDEAYVLTVVAYNSAGDSPEAILKVPAINDTGRSLMHCHYFTYNCL